MVRTKALDVIKVPKAYAILNQKKELLEAKRTLPKSHNDVIKAKVINEFLIKLIRGILTATKTASKKLIIPTNNIIHSIIIMYFNNYIFITSSIIDIEEYKLLT